MNKAIELLSKIAKILDYDIDFKDKLEPILKMMAEYMNMQRGTIAILNREKKEISIEVAYGLSNVQQSRGKYKLGEGITGKVVQNKSPMVIPKISEEPKFLNKTNSRLTKEDISFICVPIMRNNEVLCTLSADKLFSKDKSLDYDVNLFLVIAFMISEDVYIQRLEHERQHEYVLQLRDENERLREKLKDRYHPSNIIGKSKAIQEVFNLILKLKENSTTVLLLGESGVGKELVANAIHYNGPRNNKPFVKFNCSAIPENLIESELFGHLKGSFTGAIADKKGKFELADGGTIFLDEIGEMPLSLQSKILRVLQEREIDPIGASDPVKIDVAVIAATNRNLEELVAEKKFREDLYYRLNVFPIVVPSLRLRKTDIPLLIDYFIEKFSNQYNKKILRISTPAIDMLMLYHWPGNVRELQNCIERAVILTNDGVIRSYHLAPTLQTASESSTYHSGTLQESIDSLEKELIIENLKETRGNMAEAARKMGITERIMGLRIKKHDIDPGIYRNN